ncbi:MAG: polyphenol oxidase family protein [Thermoleophilia bacterium]
MPGPRPTRPREAGPADLPLVEVETGAPVRAVFSTRLGGVSTGSFAALNLGSDGDDGDENVRANRRLLCEALGVDPERVRMGRQVHGAGVRDRPRPQDAGRFTDELRGWADGDGLVERRAGAPLVVLGADCLPVLMWRRDGGGVAAAHAGWRGLVAGVLQATVAALGAPAETSVAIGPGVGPCCYEVSAEIRDEFEMRFGRQTVVGDAVHLAAAARAALCGAGVDPRWIQTLPTCTSCDDERWFSYRRDGVSGRHAGIVWATQGAA